MCSPLSGALGSNRLFFVSKDLSSFLLGITCVLCRARLPAGSFEVVPGWLVPCLATPLQPRQGVVRAEGTKERFHTLA